MPKGVKSSKKAAEQVSAALNKGKLINKIESKAKVIVSSGVKSGDKVSILFPVSESMKQEMFTNEFSLRSVVGHEIFAQVVAKIRGVDSQGLINVEGSTITESLKDVLPNVPKIFDRLNHCNLMNLFIVIFIDGLFLSYYRDVRNGLERCQKSSQFIDCSKMDEYYKLQKFTSFSDICTKAIRLLQFAIIMDESGERIRPPLSCWNEVFRSEYFTGDLIFSKHPVISTSDDEDNVPLGELIERRKMDRDVSGIFIVLFILLQCLF